MDALEAEGIGDLPVLIAAAATVRVEVGLRFEPIHEYPLPGGGYPSHYDGGGAYHGRGFIQLTHRYNYRAYGALLREDLEGQPDLALDPDIAARVLASYFRQRGIADMARRGDWQAVRRAVNGGLNGWDVFSQAVSNLEWITADEDAPSEPSLVQPVVAQNQFSLSNYDTKAEYDVMRGASCSAASLAAVLTAYGQPTNISEGLRRIRATGDDVTAQYGLMNVFGAGVGLQRALDAAGLPSTVTPQAELTRAWFRERLPERPALCQLNRYHNQGHWLVAVDADDSGVTVANSDAGPQAERWFAWPAWWQAMGNGVAVTVG